MSTKYTKDTKDKSLSDRLFFSYLPRPSRSFLLRLNMPPRTVQIVFLAIVDIRKVDEPGTQH